MSPRLQLKHRSGPSAGGPFRKVTCKVVTIRFLPVRSCREELSESSSSPRVGAVEWSARLRMTVHSRGGRDCASARHVLRISECRGWDMPAADRNARMQLTLLGQHLSADLAASHHANTCRAVSHRLFQCPTTVHCVCGPFAYSTNTHCWLPKSGWHTSWQLQICTLVSGWYRPPVASRQNAGSACPALTHRDSRR